MGRELTSTSPSASEATGVSSIGVELLEQIHADVFSWISGRLRQLPWRDVRDPWKILVSEVMLQQTSVHRVLGKWEHFVSVFPTPIECARSELADLLRIWQGLGYPRRAKNLHACAQAITENYAGRVPCTVDELMALPGIGPYTARAVVAFAFEGDAAVVDTNVVRVLKRWSGERLAPRRAQELADSLLPDGESWLWNQAIMDLGATVCRPKPVCEECPIRMTCRWRGEGPDPSASSSPSQPRFEGSARQARGRIMKALVSGAVPIDDAPRVMDREPDIAFDLVRALLEENLVRRTGDMLHL